MVKQEEKKEKREKDKVRREKLASYFYDSSKLILAGVVIGGLTPLHSSNLEDVNIYIVIPGAITTVLLAWIGNKILK